MKSYSTVTETKFNLSAQARGAICAADWMVYAIILVIGAIEFFYYPHAADFLTDPGYPDLARSILEHHSYQFDYLPETTLPPGFPLILALVGRVWGLGPAVLFRVIAVSTSLGLIAAYEFLRRVEGRGLAAAACLLLGSSPALFTFNTVVIFPEMPYLLTSMLALWLAIKIDRTEPARVPIAWMLLLGVDLVMAVLIRSVGIALLVGLGTWMFASLLVVPEFGRRRLKRFLLPLVLGVAAQLAWSVWAQRHQVLEWQLPGYPESYTAQLKVKNGQYPELGMATLGDIARRVERNLVTYTAGFGRMMTRRHISSFWSSPAIIGVLSLIFMGLGLSLRNGGELHDWYFLCYVGIFMLWPWDFVDRFIFPVVPLACLFLWRGVKVLNDYLCRQPKAAGLCFLLGGSILAAISAAFAFQVIAPTVYNEHSRGDHLQPIAAALFWGVLALIGFMMFKFSPVQGPAGNRRLFSWPRHIKKLETSSFLRIVAILLITVLVGSGIAGQWAWGRSNLHPDANQLSHGGIEAADWIRINEPSSLVIMARDQDLFFHYTGRRVVWFPPISNANVLMDGMRRFHVGVLVVLSHPWPYWLPDEDVCFQSLVRSYESAFHLRHQEPDYQVYEVVLPPDAPSVASQP